MPQVDFVAGLEVQEHALRLHDVPVAPVGEHGRLEFLVLHQGDSQVLVVGGPQPVGMGRQGENTVDEFSIRPNEEEMFVR